MLEIPIKHLHKFIRFFIDDVKKPNAQVYPVVKEVLIGEDFNFSCHAPGNSLSFQWLKNGRPIPNNQTFRKASKTVKGVTFSENLLLIKVATKQHDANYTCVVMTPSNPTYSSKATASLLVKGMIGFINVFKQSNCFYALVYLRKEAEFSTSKNCFVRHYCKFSCKKKRPRAEWATNKLN